MQLAEAAGEEGAGLADKLNGATKNLQNAQEVLCVCCCALSVLFLSTCLVCRPACTLTLPVHHAAWLVTLPPLSLSGLSVALCAGDQDHRLCHGLSGILQRRAGGASNT